MILTKNVLWENFSMFMETLFNQCHSSNGAYYVFELAFNHDKVWSARCSQAQVVTIIDKVRNELDQQTYSEEMLCFYIISTTDYSAGKKGVFVILPPQTPIFDPTISAICTTYYDSTANNTAIINALGTVGNFSVNLRQCKRASFFARLHRWLWDFTLPSTKPVIDDWLPRGFFYSKFFSSIRFTFRDIRYLDVVDKDEDFVES